MLKFNCPICENPISLPEDVKVGQRLTCERCSAQLAVHKHRRRFFLGCPLCQEEVFDPMKCDACERRRELKKIYEVDI